MRIAYVLLSPTFGIHQYTADLANRMVRAGHSVHLVTTAGYPADRYLPDIVAHTPITTRNAGFSRDALQWGAVGRVVSAIREIEPDLVHITGPHLWNLPLMAALRRRGPRVLHTLHDLDPHPGSPYGALLHLWNGLVMRWADHILVHGKQYLRRLEDRGMGPDRVTYTPLLHLFVGHTWLDRLDGVTGKAAYEPFVLLFGRLAPYKGIPELLSIWPEVVRRRPGVRLVLAGSGSLDGLWQGPLPEGVEVRNHLIQDEEAVDLFRRCALLVLPYTGATQSALIPAAYCFRKPVIASRSGALPEYVQEGETGWLVEPGRPESLADALADALDGMPDDSRRLAQMGLEARAWYDRQRIEEEEALLDLYARLAPEPVPARAAASSVSAHSPHNSEET